MKTAQLSLMVNNLRAEAGHALGVAQGTNNYETLKYLLARTQEELWTAYIWPELKLRADSSLFAGQFQYTYQPTMSFDSIREVYTSMSTGDDFSWKLVEYGISDDKIAPGGANSSRADPIQYWDVDSPTMYRVWPTPNSNASVRFVGQKALNPFTADSDVSTLDSTCIVLFTAADLLARAKAEDAATKMAKAQRHLLKLLGNKVSAKNKVSSLGGGAPISIRHRHFGINVGN